MRNSVIINQNSSAMAGVSEEEQLRKQFMSPFVEQKDVHFVQSQVSMYDSIYVAHICSFSAEDTNVPKYENTKGFYGLTRRDGTGRGGTL